MAIVAVGFDGTEPVSATANEVIGCEKQPGKDALLLALSDKLRQIDDSVDKLRSRTRPVRF